MNLNIEQIQNDDEDEDTDNEPEYEKELFVDYIGDIDSKLKINKIHFQRQQCQPQHDGVRVFKQLLSEYRNEFGANDSDQKSYFHRKRLISMVDRRRNRKRNSLDDLASDQIDENNISKKPNSKLPKMPKREADMVYLYEAPEIAQNIPENALSEWYIGASRLCLLPDMAFGDGTQYLKSHDVQHEVWKFGSILLFGIFVGNLRILSF